jgi:hypothetical protein
MSKNIPKEQVLEPALNGNTQVTASNFTHDAFHDFVIKDIPKEPGTEAKTLGSLHFQEGPIKEAGVNGVTMQDLLAIVVNRLESFQKSQFKCNDNATALLKVKDALLALNARTAARLEKGVEGTHNV